MVTFVFDWQYQQ